MTRRAIVLLVASLGMGGTAGAASGADAPPAFERVTVYHWWTSPSESAALGALVKAFSQKYSDVTVVSVPLSGRGVRALFPTIQKLFVGKQPPDAFQGNGGSSAQVFYDAELLSPIDDLWATEHLEDVVPPVIREMNQFEGHYYSVPVNVHRLNVVWYNRPLLDKYKLDPATLTTWEAFFKAAQTLREGGVASPIQLGATWTVGHLFGCIMASQGVGAYEDWINGKMTSADDPRLVSAFTILRSYLAFVNKDHADVAWDVAVRRVMNGESAFCAMGDWANGEFRVSGKKYGKDYGAMPVPGSAGLFGVSIDTFLHPRGLADETGSRRWLSLAASREGQDAFNPFKGSIPARRDADAARYDVYQRSAIDDMKASQHLYPSGSATLPTAFSTQLSDVLVAFMADQDVKKAATTVAGAAARLKATGQFRRSWALK